MWKPSIRNMNVVQKRVNDVGLINLIYCIGYSFGFRRNIYQIVQIRDRSVTSKFVSFILEVFWQLRVLFENELIMWTKRRPKTTFLNCVLYFWFLLLLTLSFLVVPSVPVIWKVPTGYTTRFNLYTSYATLLPKITDRVTKYHSFFFQQQHNARKK